MVALKSFLIFLSVFSFFKAQAEELKTAPLSQLKSYLTYTKTHDPIHLKFTRFPLASSYASTWGAPVLPKTFLIKIPNGRVYSKNGYVIVAKKYLIKELLWSRPSFIRQRQSLNIQTLPEVKRLKGRVVVLAQEGHNNYYYWITKILPKLALLKSIQYDWLYLPRLTHPFQRETLDLMGIDPAKIIEADRDTYIEADMLIVPSVGSTSVYTPRWAIEYLQKNLIAPAATGPGFSKNVFVSRQKAAYRRILNEDDVFALFQPLGFKRYNLEDLKFVEQVQLFQNAEVVVSFNSAGLTNLIFSKPGTHVIEIFQEHEDDVFCYLSQALHLKYDCLKTTRFKKNSVYTNTTVPLESIKDLIKRKLRS